MRFNFNQVLSKLDGTTLFVTEIKVTDGVAKSVDTEEAMKLKTPCINALMGQYEDEKTLSGEEKLKRYDLATRIQASINELEITPEELTLIRKLVAKAYSPLILGQVWHLLDTPPKEATPAS